MEFTATFQISKMVVFNVRYTTVGGNEHPYFSTSAGKFIRSKRDYSTCGQCQEHVLPKNSAAYKFYDKWDGKHLKRLGDAELAELNRDIEELRKVYNNIFFTADKFGRDGDGRDIRFSEIVELSKQEPKRIAKAA